MIQKKTNFFLVGAAKCGTSSLYNVLAQHKDIFLSPIKEPNFFSTDIDPNNFSKAYKNNTFLSLEEYFKNTPLKTLQLSFIRNGADYIKLFEGVENEPIIGECSTSYLYSSKAAKEIHTYNPDAKILVCLRNPIKRCFSHYLMALKYGHVSKGFKASIQTDIEASSKGWGQSELFLELGMYYEQIQRYYRLFPKVQIKVILFEDLIQNSQTTFDEIFDFMGISRIPVALEKDNAAKAPKHAKINKLLTNSGIKKKALKLIPEQILSRIKKGYYTSENLPSICKQDYHWLEKYYKQEFQMLESFIDKDLSIWNTTKL